MPRDKFILMFSKFNIKLNFYFEFELYKATNKKAKQMGKFHSDIPLGYICTVYQSSQSNNYDVGGKCYFRTPTPTPLMTLT